ncbi:Tyrosinase [Lachnellula willkommii]|uniref:Tyrosinase n=1 Tax=Lachnellula willkommii TaxID=215461 RepID=A0A559MLL3_9HELO|nr:Tyrosinase [Lachnellula willkommii]
MHFLKRSSAGLLAILGASCIQSTYADDHGSYNYDSVRNLARNPIVPRQSTQNFYPVTGPASNGTVVLRQEIRELQKNQTLWTLYVLALDILQYTNQTDMLSWYQIGGIHGEPYAPWDNVQPGPGLENSGYCHHVSILFPTWHRPYLALFEQVMYNLVQEIALMWPAGSVQDQYVGAAKNFRIPFWDWAAVPSDGGVLPDIVQDSPSMSVDGPAGTQMIANPLFTYQFKPVDPKAFIYTPFNEETYVLRYPNNNTASAFSQNDLVARQLDNNAATFRSRLYNLFGAYHNYSTFSNTGWYPDNTDGDYDSIEGIHDQIHALVGSGGHMSVTDYSAFDPLFMLHHANIDRLFAMWQVVNPDSYVVPTAATADTYNFATGDTLDSQSILTPFHDTSGNYWNSDTVRDTHTFGYAYPETNGGSDVNVTDQVLKAINALYGDKTTNGTDGNNTPQRRDAVVNHREWLVNLKADKHALNGSFFVHIFLGDFGSDPKGWSFEANLVGTWAVLDKFNTANAPNKPVSGTIPLTGVLSKLVLANKLPSLDPDVVPPYLAANLKYRVTLLDDTEVGNGDVPSLSLMVISAPVVPPQTDSELPAWGATWCIWI